MSHPRLQKAMKENHVFLFRLFKGNSRKNRHTLQNATAMQIYCVLRVLYCFSAGHIPILKETFQEIIKRKKRHLLARLKSRSIFLRKGPLLEQKKYVLQYSSVYPYLFQPLFEK